MMKSTNSRHGNDLAACVEIRLRLTASRSSFAQSDMRSVVVVVSDVLLHESSQMALVEYDHMVE